MNQLTRQDEVLKNCCQAILTDIGKKAKAEQAAYNKRNYAQGSKMKPCSLLYLRMSELQQEMRERLRRLRLAEDWIEEFIEMQFQVRRKNSRGHDGIRKKR